MFVGAGIMGSLVETDGEWSGYQYRTKVLLSRETIVVQNSISSDSHRWSVQWRFETALNEAQMF